MNNKETKTTSPVVIPRKTVRPLPFTLFCAHSCAFELLMKAPFVPVSDRIAAGILLLTTQQDMGINTLLSLKVDEARAFAETKEGDMALSGPSLYIEKAKETFKYILQLRSEAFNNTDSPYLFLAQVLPTGEEIRFTAKLVRDTLITIIPSSPSLAVVFSPPVESACKVLCVYGFEQLELYFPTFTAYRLTFESFMANFWEVAEPEKEEEPYC